MAKDRTNPDVIGAIGDRPLELFHRVSGFSDQQAAADDFAGLGDPQIPLAEVDAIGFGQAGDVGPVVDKKIMSRFRG